MWIISQDRRYIVHPKAIRLDGPLHDQHGVVHYRLVAIADAGLEVLVARFTSAEAAQKEMDAIIMKAVHGEHHFCGKEPAKVEANG